MERRNRILSTAACAALFALTSCTDHRRTVVVTPPPPPVPVDITVEVYDPVTGGVWENVGVRIVAAYNEWSDCVCESPFPDFFILTDSYGIAPLTAWDIADYEVGFVTDPHGRAVLGYPFDVDEAVVWIEIWAPGFDPVEIELDLTWRDNDVFISVPF